jgi:hypothetical protein
MTGWECPRCRRIWSPSVRQCEWCSPDKAGEEKKLDGAELAKTLKRFKREHEEQERQRRIEPLLPRWPAPWRRDWTLRTPPPPAAFDGYVDLKSLPRC